MRQMLAGSCEHVQLPIAGYCSHKTSASCDCLDPCFRGQIQRPLGIGVQRIVRPEPQPSLFPSIAFPSKQPSLQTSVCLCVYSSILSIQAVQALSSSTVHAFIASQLLWLQTASLCPVLWLNNADCWQIALSALNGWGTVTTMCMPAMKTCRRRNMLVMHKHFACERDRARRAGCPSC